MKKVNKFNMIHLEFAHLKPDGTLVLCYEKTDKESGKTVDWQVNEQWIKPNNAQARRFDVQFSSVCIHRNITKLLPYIERVEVWPVYNEYALREQGKEYIANRVTSVVLHLSNGTYLQFAGDFNGDVSLVNPRVSEVVA